MTGVATGAVTAVGAAVGAAEFVGGLEAAGVRLVTGVPCSYFAGPLRLLAGHPRLRYVPAANEGSALAIAAGAQLAGAPAAVLAQNSGFGNLVNPLTSLVLPYRIPLLVFLSMRGWPAAGPGEPQHRWMGQVVPGWLASLEIPQWTLTAGGPPLAGILAAAGPVLEAGGTAFVLVGKGAIGSTVDAVDAAASPAGSGEPALGRDEVVDAVLAEVRDEHLLATTGYLSRSLFNRGDRPGNLYLQGSMGHVAGLALGAALARPDRRVVVLDGDGSLLMHLGCLATIGHFAPPNLLHLVFDNGGYESTGGQPTAAGRADHAAMARACGYRTAHRLTGPDGLRSAIRAALDQPGPALLSIRVRAGGATGDRASESLPVTELARRFAASFGPAPEGAR